MTPSPLRLLALLPLAGCGGLSVLVPTTEGETDGLETVGDLTETDADADVDTDADADADSDSDADPDTGTAPCDPPDLWDLGAQGPAGGTFDPTYFGVSLYGVVESSQVLDLSFDGVDASAWLVFTFYDASVVPLCDVIFDASETASPTSDPATPSGQQIYESWTFSTLVANPAWTNCPTMAGGIDPRQWAADRTWGFALGEMVDNTAPLSQAVNASYPGTWATDWAPHVFATFLDVGGAEAFEVGWAFLYEHDCYDVASGTTPEPTPTNGPIDGYVATGQWLLLNVDNLP